MSWFYEEINWTVSGKFIILDLIGIDTYPRYGFAFSAYRFLANLSLFSLSHSWATEIWEAPEHLGAPRMFGSEGQNPTQHSIWLENPHYSYASVRGDSELWDPLEASHSTSYASLIEHWKGLLKAQLKCQPRDKTLWKLDSFFRVQHMKWIRGLYGTGFTVERIRGFENQGIWIVDPLTVTPRNWLTAFVLLVFMM